MKLRHALFLFLGLSALTMPPSLARTPPGSLIFEPFVFESAAGDRVDAERGRLRVPEVRAGPGGRTVELALVRFRSTSLSPGSPIVYLAGGPGGSGIDAARGTRFALFMALRQFGDVIALDQRGTGGSRPRLDCGDRLDLPADRPATRRALLAAYKKASRACARSWRRRGVDLRGFNTQESADDLDDLRRALAADKISLWGISYGTHLGLTTIRRHGAHIDRAIFAGVEGPDHTQKLPSTYRAHLRQLEPLVRADPDAGPEIPDLERLAETVTERLDRNPVPITVTDPKTGAGKRVLLTGFLLNLLLYDLWGTDGIVYLPYFYLSVSKGDFADLARLMAMDAGIGSAMRHMMDCSSGASPERRRQVREEAGDRLFADLNFPFMEVCEAWGNPDLGPGFRAPVRSSVPVLFISGTLDAKTPPANAEEVARGFPNSRHLIVDGAAHSDPLFLSSPRIGALMADFMKGRPLAASHVCAPPLKFVMSSPFAPGQ